MNNNTIQREMKNEMKIGKKEFKTRGLDSDQTVAAIKATQKMLNVISI
mgnify:CR=1 FL=1